MFEKGERVYLSTYPYDEGEVISYGEKPYDDEDPSKGLFLYVTIKWDDGEMTDEDPKYIWRCPE